MRSLKNSKTHHLLVRDLSVHYGQIQAVKGISFHVNKGEAVALIGANGAGKSSTLMAISGSLKIANGHIFLGRQEINTMPSWRIVREGVALVVEGRAILGELSVLDNLMAGAYIRNDHQAIQDDLEEMFVRFPRLKQRQTQIAGTLSGGEQQMLAIARALMSRPKILLLDEPSMGLAPLIVDEIFELLNDLRQAGLTMLLVEQNAVKALEASNRAYILANGRIVHSGNSTDLLNDDSVREAYLGSSVKTSVSAA